MNDRSSYETPDPNQYGYGQQPGPYPVPPAPAPKRKSHRTRNWLIGVGVAVLLLFGGCTVSLVGGAVEATKGDRAPVISTDTPSPSKARTLPQPARTPKPVEKVPSFLPEDGTLEVGPDVKPGTYKTRVPADSYGCYWARLKDTDGGLDSIISTGLAQPGALVTVTIKASDAAVEMRGCGSSWRRAR